MITMIRQRAMRSASGVNPYLTVVAAARRNPRAAMVVLGGAGVGAAVMVLVAVSAAQAFVVISHQSSNNTHSRFSLAVNQTDDGNGDSPSEDSTAGLTTDAGPADGSTSPRPDQSAQPTGSGRPTGVVGSDEVVSVQGIRVHHSIADDVERLLAAAEADGINLSGWGWRDNKTQIRLRRQHCGTSEYAIYRMPSSRCSPPTARPGRSQHEWGLAIDFTYNGGSISSHRSPGFKWLNANAATYGLKNLASEPWHWSTTGR